jgi:transcription initiation factor TFIIIB Brf1 subunit/transcription initiation factor TFIIB
MATRRCRVCKKTKTLDEDHYEPNVRHKKTTGYRQICRVCLNAYRREKAAINPRSYIKRLCSQLKYGRKKRDPHLSWTVTPDDLFVIYQKQDGRCALTGEMMTHDYGLPTNISIDRINSSGNYEPQNIQLVCARINMMRGTMSVEEFKSWCSKVEGSDGR